MSSRLITLMLAGASLIHCWLPEAVTTTVSRSLVEASALASAAARPGRASRQAVARAQARRVRGRRAEGVRNDRDMTASIGGGGPGGSSRRTQTAGSPLPWVVGRTVRAGAAGWVSAVRKTATCLVNEMITVRVCYDPVPGATKRHSPARSTIACCLLNGDKSRHRPSHSAYIRRPRLGRIFDSAPLEIVWVPVVTDSDCAAKGRYSQDKCGRREGAPGTFAHAARPGRPAMPIVGSKR